jgi:hypothetical protein
MKRLFVIATMALTLSGCGYDGHYRYPCQDPANWEKAECNPPICDATGTCTKDLVPISDGATATIDITTDEESQNG